MNKINEEVLNNLGLKLNQEFELAPDSPFRDKDEVTFKFVSSGDDIVLLGKYNGKWRDWCDFIPVVIRRTNKIYPVIPILDEVEKKYLKNVFRPFKSRITTICLNSFTGPSGFGFITATLTCINDESQTQYFSLPEFKLGKMYKGMQINKEYTLEELGLFK